MTIIYDLLNEVQVNNVKFVPNTGNSYSRSLTFDVVYDFVVPESKNAFDNLVFDLARTNIGLIDTNSVLTLGVRKKAVHDLILERAIGVHIKNWLLVNNKKEWRRTALSKKMTYLSAESKKLLVEIFIDAVNYGLDPSRESSRETEVKQLHKFVAAKFEAALGFKNGSSKK